MAKVRGVRLLSGEDLIGDLDEESIEYGLLFVNKPLQIVMGPGPNGQMSIGLAPFIPFKKGTRLDLPASSVLFVYDINEDLVKAYTQATSSIVIAGANELPPEQPQEQTRGGLRLM
jgi:hypothetical protein